MKEIDLKYILTYLLVAFSCISFFSSNQLNFSLMLGIGLFLFYKRKMHVDKGYIKLLLFIIGLILFQTIIFRFFSLWTTIGTLTRFSMPYFIIRVIGKDYFKYYVKILYVFTIVSLLLYLSSLIYNPIIDVLFNFAQFLKIDYGNAPYYQNMIFYTVENFHYGVLRNSGFAWEPGAFSGLLLVGLFLNSIIENSIINKRNIVFIIAVLTTISTGGYLTLMVYFFGSFLLFYKKKGKVIILLLMIFVMFFAYNKLEFLNKKIENQINLSRGIGASYESQGRFGSFLIDFKDALKHPIAGRGRNINTRYENIINEQEMHRTNGVGDFLVKYGFIMFFIYFFMIFLSFKKMIIFYNYNLKFAYLGVIIVLMVGFFEVWFQSSFFISLIYYYMLPNKSTL